MKARLVVQGFTDQRLGMVQTASPTCSRRGRQLFLAMAASMRMKVETRDVRTAFLQGDVDAGEIDVLCEPIKELKEKLGLEQDQVVRLLKAVYGLVDAPVPGG